MFSTPDKTVYYPQLRDAVYSEDGISVIESDNVLKSAIKQNQVIPLSNHQAVEQSFDKVFAEANGMEGLSADDLRTPLFHSALSRLIKQFSCELYSSQQPSDSIQICPPDNQIVDNNLDHLPFNAGIREYQRLSTAVIDDNQSFEMELFLKSTLERPLDSLWGAVHELGSFKGSDLSADTIVLTVNMNAHKKDPQIQRWRSIHQEPLVFFVTLPPVETLLAQENEVSSMRYAYQNAKLLAVDSR